jgi:MarR family transcriptional regulator, organic hydroperoxide resistance regulator
MEYSHNDTELVAQPIGYWSWAAHKAVVTYIRAGLGRFGVSQPQWWTMAQVADSERGKTREEVTAILEGYLDVGAGLGPEVDALLERGWLTLDDEKRLQLTPAGNTVYGQCAELQGGMRTTIHDGITDEEYLTALKVLQRMIHNVGGKAWHH